MISKKHYKQLFIKDLANEAYSDLQKAKKQLEDMKVKINELLQIMGNRLEDLEIPISGLKDKNAVEYGYEMEKEMNGYPVNNKRTKKDKKK